MSKETPEIDVSGKNHGDDDAGNISVTLHEMEGGVVQIDGTHTKFVTKEQRIRLLAKGADGENGKIGADGKDGAPGRNGINAGYYLSGGNGGTGGKGGPGKEGTHGKNGGQGGTVKVTVNEKDLALLDVIEEINTSGGMGGKAGRHGRGGRGGPGGRGGAAFNWTSTERVQRPVYRNGRRRYETVLVSRRRTMPAGQDGLSGPDGFTPSTPLYPGKRGLDGEAVFYVEEASGKTSRHSKPYNLQLSLKKVEPFEGNGIFEPGDHFRATYELENTGLTMRSPNEDIPIRLQPGILQSNVIGLVQGSIEPGSSRLCSQPLLGKLPASQAHAGLSPYEKRLALEAGAINNRLQRPYQTGINKTYILVRYPVQLAETPENIVIAEGEVATLPANLNNISTKALGYAEGRSVELRFVDNENPTFFNKYEIDTILAGEDLSRNCPIMLSEGTPEGTIKSFSVELHLQTLDRQGLTLIQKQPMFVQLTPKYEKTSSGFTLVINSNTSAAAFNYWKNLLEALSGGQKVSIWNTSYYNDFPIDAGNDRLLQDAAEGTLVVVNNSYKQGIFRELHHHDEKITTGHLQRATQQYGASLVMVGEEKNKMKKSTTIWPTESKEHASIKDFILYILANNHEQTDSKAPLLFHKIPLETTGCFKSRNYVSERTEQLKNDLEKSFPNRLFHIEVDRPAEGETTATIRVLPLGSKLDTQLYRAPLSEEEQKNPENKGDDNQQAILEAMPFIHKLKLFSQHQSSVYQKQFANHIIKDLLAEQKLLSKGRTYGSWWEILIRRYRQDFKKELVRLNNLVTHLNVLAQKNPEAFLKLSPKITDIINSVKTHAEEQNTFWLKLKHFFFPQAKKIMIDESKKMCGEISKLQSAAEKHAATNERASTTKSSPSLQNHGLFSEKSGAMGLGTLYPIEGLAASR